MRDLVTITSQSARRGLKNLFTRLRHQKLQRGCVRIGMATVSAWLFLHCNVLKDEITRGK